MPDHIPPVEFPLEEAGPEYKLRDPSSLCHCCQGMASLMPDCTNGLVNRIREKPEKILSLHLVFLEAPTHIAGLPQSYISGYCYSNCTFRMNATIASTWNGSACGFLGFDYRVVNMLSAGRDAMDQTYRLAAGDNASIEVITQRRSPLYTATK